MKKATIKDEASWLSTTLDIYAQDMYGEFGYNTCTEKEQLQVLEAIITDKMITFPDDTN